MKRRLIQAGIAAWLLLWATDTGLLVYSRPYPDNHDVRDCYYLVGATIVMKPGDGRGDEARCALLRRMSGSL